MALFLREIGTELWPGRATTCDPDYDEQRPATEMFVSNLDDSDFWQFASITLEEWAQLSVVGKVLGCIVAVQK